MPRQIALFAKKIAYVFKNIAWLELALTHCSYSQENNERLEFLGDAVLNFWVAEKLFQEYPKHREGDLSRLRANVVNGEVLAALALRLEINQYLKMGAGELKSGGLKRKSTLSDAMEAVIGAIYLDGGMEACSQQIAIWFSDILANAASCGAQKDPKTQLQEYMQAHKLPLPIYQVLSVEGDENAQLFQVRCELTTLGYKAEASGSSRKRAEQNAAAKLLYLLGMSV